MPADEPVADSTEPKSGTQVVMTTTWACRRQHYALPSLMRGAGRTSPGLRGPALCDSPRSPVEVYDQLAIRAALTEAGVAQEAVEKVVVAKLPVCGLCERKIAAMHKRT
jgi:hypothetical protein